MRTSRADVVLGLALAVLTPVWSLGADRRTSLDTPLDALGVVLLVLAALPVTVRRRWPVPALAVTAVAVTTYLLLGYPYGPVFFPYVVAVYTVARWLPTAVAGPAAAVAAVLVLSHILVAHTYLPGFIGLFPGIAWTAVPFAIGTTVRQFRESARRDREESVQRHVEAERLRVAQEVHDVVGHGLAAISLQAGVARHVIERDPAKAAEALEAITRTSNAALEELRSTLAVVRRGVVAGEGVDGSRSPTPGLDQVEALCGRMRDAGMRIDLTVDGDPRAVPSATGLAGYRVVQEALTNALRHGLDRSATVRVAYGPDAVDVRVTNPVGARRTPARVAADVTGAADATRRGLGIPGMRERVGSLGGTLHAAVDDTGRTFVVTAHLPDPGARP